MKLDYPPYLGKNFRILEWYGAEMKLHGNGTKRNIRFDDDAKDLYIDIKIPEEDYWHKVDGRMAADFKARHESDLRTRTKSTLERISANCIPLSERRHSATVTLGPRLIPESRPPNIFARNSLPTSSAMATVANEPDEIIYISPKKRT